MAKVIACDESKEYFFREGCHILEMWNDPADPDVSIARARVEPGKTTRSHQLSDTVERYVILEGSGSFLSNGSNQSISTAVKAGDVVVIPAAEPQAIENTGSTDLIFLAICSPRFSEENYSDNTVEQVKPR